MSGTKAGGLKAAQTNKKKHGKDFYARIGAEGGRNGHTGGFYADRKMARLAGALGGAVSRRGRKPTPQTAEEVKEAKRRIAKYQFEKAIAPYEDIEFEIPKRPKRRWFRRK